MSDDPISKWILTEGNATKITRISPIGGGCINVARRYDTDAGSFFIKTNRYSHYLSVSFFGQSRLPELELLLKELLSYSYSI